MGFVRSIVVLSIVVVCIAILLSIVEDKQYDKNRNRPEYLGPIRNRRPINTQEFGRYNKPLSNIDFSWVSSSKIFNFISLKHWIYVSISTQRYFIVAAIADLNYFANAFVYIIDRTDREKSVYVYAAQSILARSIEERANSSIDGCTHFYRSSSESIRICYNTQESRYELKGHVPMNDNLQVSFDCQIDFSCEKDQSMVLLYPVDVTRPAYTHKLSALSARGQLRFSNENVMTFDDGLSSLDWTLGYAERVCRWKW
jgi:hypothetical protein